MPPPRLIQPFENIFAARARAFSLVQVTLAIGIVSFAVPSTVVSAMPVTCRPCDEP